MDGRRPRGCRNAVDPRFDARAESGKGNIVAGEVNQAAYLEDMLTTWRTLGYTGPTFVWTLQDRNTASADPEDTFGVIRSDGTWKPAAYAIQELASQSGTTPAMARTAFALPEAQQPAPVAAASQVVATALQPATATVAAPAPETPVVTQAKAVAAQRKIDRQDRRAERAAQAPSAPKAAADTPRRSAAAPRKEPAAASKRNADKRDRHGDDRRRDRHVGHRG